MTKWIVFLLFTFISINYSQNILSRTGGKFYVGINAGPSFPLSDFASNDPNTPSSGYAVTGYKIELNAGMRLFDIVDLSVLGFRNVNPTNADNLAASLNNLYPGNNFAIDSEEWIIYGSLGGFSISYLLSDKLIADVRILGGYLNISSPEFNFKTLDPDSFYKVEGSNEASFVYFSSFGIRYPIMPKWYASFAIEYIGSTVDFYDVKTIKSINGNLTESRVTFERIMNSLAFTAGIKLFVL